MELSLILVLLSYILLIYIPPSLQIKYCGSGASGMEVWEDYCYAFPYTSSTYGSAINTCAKSYGAQLASIHSAAEAKYIHDKLLPIAYVSYWIGMKKNGTDKDPLKANYYWLDGTTVDYENWAPNEPNDFEGSAENCVEVYLYSGALEAKWNDYNCNFYRQFVCKTPVVGGWLDYNGNQYYMSNAPGQIDVTWYEARDWCMQRGADLASILTDPEKTQVATWAGKNAYNGDLWIGLNKLAGKRDAWGWSDGSSYSWKNWKALYPIDEEYGHLCGYQASNDKNGKWVNGHCDIKKGFVCKRPTTSNPTPKTTQPTQEAGGFCPAGYYGSGNKCFKVVMPGQMGERGLTFEQAIKKCREEPGVLPSLASIHSDLEQAYVSAQLQRVRLGVWIGLRKPLLSDDWTWADSSPLDYQHWAPGKPEDDEDGHHCAEVWMILGTVGMWNNVKCSDKRGYVCQTYKDVSNIIPTSAAPSVSFTCPSGFTPYFYGCFRYEPTKLTYERARDECTTSHPDAKLVGIHVETENAAMQTVSINQNTDLWIGLQDSDGDGEYKWEDGWWILFVNWANGQPVKDVDGGCVYMSQDGKWSDTSCGVEKASVCKISQVPPFTTPPTMEGRCPSGTGWFEYHEHCYLLLPEGYSTWSQAKQYCQSNGPLSSLLSIHGYMENKMIHDHLILMGHGRTNVWIGLYRSDIDKVSLKWTDGSIIQYAAFAPHEPNGEVDEDNCFEMDNAQWPGMWNDLNCDDYKGYVCKAPKIPHITVPTLAPHCDPGWKHSILTGACYLFQPDNLHPFKAAQEFCQSKEAELASIHGAFESKYVEEEMMATSTLPISGNDNFWIGLFAWKNADTQNYEYRWTDKSELDYENWKQSEPALPESYPCGYAIMSTGKWTLGKCERSYGFLCKKAAKSTQKPDTGNGTGGMSGGQVAGTVIGVLLGVMLLAFIAVAVLVQKQVIDNPITRFTLTRAGLDTSQVNYEKTI